MILAEILKHTREEITLRQRLAPQEELAARAREVPRPRRVIHPGAQVLRPDLSENNHLRHTGEKTAAQPASHDRRLRAAQLRRRDAPLAPAHQEQRA